MFDYDSLHKEFEALETLHGSALGISIRMARSNLAGYVRGLSRATDDKVAVDTMVERDKGNMFIGDATSLASVQLVPALVGSEQGSAPAHFLAQLRGRAGLDPEAAYHLAMGIHTYLTKNNLTYNPDTWQMLSRESLAEMIGALNASMVDILMRVPCPEPNLAKAMATRRPAEQDLRHEVLLRVITPDTETLTWTLVETQGYAALMQGRPEPLWVDIRGVVKVDDIRREKRDKVARMRNSNWDNIYDPGKLRNAQQSPPPTYREFMQSKVYPPLPTKDDQ